MDLRCGVPEKCKSNKGAAKYVSAARCARNGFRVCLLALSPLDAKTHRRNKKRTAYISMQAQTHTHVLLCAIVVRAAY